MLNKRERYEVLKLFRICSNLAPFPIQVDLEKWQLKPSSTAKQCVCFVSYVLYVLHTLYKSGSLAYTYLFVPDAQLHQLILHAILAMGSIMVVFWYYVLFVKSPGLLATYVEMTLLGNIGGTDLGQNDQLDSRPWRSRLREYSLQDLTATCLPGMLAVTDVFIAAAYIYDQSMRFLLYAALPGDLQTWATFGLCLLEEVRFIVIIQTTVGSIWLLQVIGFDLVCNQLRLSIRKIQKGEHSRRSVYKFLRHLQLYMVTFNNINKDLIFSWKLASISMCIVSGYAAIAHFREFPVFGIMYYALLVDNGVFYTLVYDKAFAIPELFERTVSCARLHMHGHRTGVFGRQMRSIPPIGVEVGHFHRMERESTLIFMNFVVVNIVNMLVAYA